jgi:hypothetical protein
MADPRKKYRKPTETEKVYLKSAKRDIKRKPLNEAQETALGNLNTPKSGMHSSMDQTSKSQREAAIRRGEQKLKALTETKLGERVQKISEKKGGEKTKLEYNPTYVQSEIDRAKSLSSFKNNSPIHDKFNEMKRS